MQGNKTTDSAHVPRKSAREVEIDHLLAEEFQCDPAFADRFLAGCGLPCAGLRVSSVTPEPGLGGDGFGDLLVQGTAGGLRIALLIENKVTAAPAFRQALRYAAYADKLRNEGWDRVFTILAAPASYRGERSGFDASIDLENVAALLASPDPVRLAWRRAIIERAVRKKAATGVLMPDLALHALRSRYLRYAEEWCRSAGPDLRFPALRDSYDEGDSWIAPIRAAAFPAPVFLRHRLWTSSKAACGMVDLIVSPVAGAMAARMRDSAPPRATPRPYGNGKGMRLSIATRAMRQASGFDADVAMEALTAMRTLTEWYVGPPD